MIAGGWAAWLITCGALAWASFWVSATCWAFGEMQASWAHARGVIEQTESEARLRRSEARAEHSFDSLEGL